MSSRGPKLWREGQVEDVAIQFYMLVRNIAATNSHPGSSSDVLHPKDYAAEIV